MQRWQVVQHELIPELRLEAGLLTPKLERGFIRWNGCGSKNLSNRPGVVHDSQTAIPLALMTQGWVTHCYDLMDRLLVIFISIDLVKTTVFRR